MKSCPNVHGLWSSDRVPVANVLIHRVPLEFPIIFLGIYFKSICLFTRVSKTKTTNGVINANGKTTTKKIYGSNDQEAFKEKSEILCAGFRSYWIKNLCSGIRRKIFLSTTLHQGI